MTIPLKVLIMEDRSADAELMIHELRRAGFDPAWQRVETEADFLRALDSELDVILADYSLPQFDAGHALKLLQDRGLDIPFVIVSGSISEQVAVDAIKHGATDYLLKDRLSRLGQAITSALEQKRLREEKRRADQAVAESEKRFRALVERSQDAIALVRPDGTILYASPGAARITGVTPEELIGRDMFKGIHPDELERAKQVFNQVLQKSGAGVASQFRLKHRDGAWRWVEGIGTNLLAEQSVQAIVINYHDITERQRAEKEILRRNQELTALNRIGEAVSSLSSSSEVLERIYVAIGQVLENRNLYIALYDEASQSISFPVYSIEGERRAPASRPFGKGITEHIIHTKTPRVHPQGQTRTRCQRARRRDPQLSDCRRLPVV